MSLMNLTFGLLIYEDPSHTAPLVRTPDITREYQGVTVYRPRSDEYDLNPGETATIAATERALGIDNTTQFSLSRPDASSDVVRLTWTGVGSNPLFRTKRNLSTDATTTVSINRVAPNSVRISTSSGTPFSTGAVLVGDFVQLPRTTDTFTSAFAQGNQDVLWQVQAKTASTIDILDNGAFIEENNVTLGSDFAMQFRVLSQAPTRIGDTLELGSGVNAGNIGKFQIINLSSDYVEFVNPLAVDETFTVNANISVYDRLIGFVMIRATGPFKLLVDGQASGAKVGMLQSEALYLGSIEAHQLQAVNEGTQPITIKLQYASVIG